MNSAKATALWQKFPPLIFHIVYFMLAVTFCFLFYIKVIKITDFNAQGGINAVLTFDTVKPFQYRLLVPLLLKVFMLFQLVSVKLLFVIYSVVVVYLIILAYYFVLTEYFENNFTNALLAPFIIYPMVWNYVLINDTLQYYDFTAILLFTAGIYLIIKDNFKALLVVFVIGLLNKETIVYLIIAYLFFNYKTVFTKKIILNTLFLGIIFIAYKVLLYFIFISNQSASIELGYLNNLKIVSRILTNRIVAKDIIFNFGGLYIFGILFFITGNWKVFKDTEFRGKLFLNLVIVPAIIIVGIYAYFEEVRVYTELIPLITTLSLMFFASKTKLHGGLKYKNEHIINS